VGGKRRGRELRDERDALDAREWRAGRSRPAVRQPGRERLDESAPWLKLKLSELPTDGRGGFVCCLTCVGHQGLKNAIGQVLGAQWQRCCVHFVRDMLGHVPRQAQPMVRGALKQIFAARDREAAGDTLASVVAQLEPAAGKVARLLEAAEEELLAHMRFPREHWPKIRRL
jgi:transposase-like protein